MSLDRLGRFHACTFHRRDHRRDQGDPRRAAAACVGRRAAWPLLRSARARPQLRDSVRRPRGVPARPARDPARRAEPDLHHARQHAAAGRRHPVFPGDRSEARVVRFVESTCSAITQLAQTTLRSIIGRMELDKTFEERDQINAQVVAALDQAARELGREGAALRDQGPDAAGRDPAVDAGADHGRAREARGDRDVGGQPPAGRSTWRSARARPRSRSPRARSRPRSTSRRARRRPRWSTRKPTPRRSA